MSSAQEANAEQIINEVDAAVPEESVKESEASVSPLVSAAVTEKTINNYDSIVSLNYLNMGGSSSTMSLKKETNPRDEKSLRVQIYRPLQPILPSVQEEVKGEITTPTAVHKAIVEEPKVETLTPEAQVAIIEEPKIELVAPVAYCAVIEEPQLGRIKAADGTELILLSDEIDEFEQYSDVHKSLPDVFESANEQNNHNDSIEDERSCVARVGPNDFNSCSCARKFRETETQTSRNRNVTIRQRASLRQQGARSSTGGIVCGTSSNYDSSEQLQHKLKVNTHPSSQSTFKQRQLELHRHRIAVEQKRLELLELKIARERDEMLRDRILFEKELDLKSTKIRKMNEDRLDL